MTKQSSVENKWQEENMNTYLTQSCPLHHFTHFSTKDKQDMNIDRTGAGRELIYL